MNRRYENEPNPNGNYETLRQKLSRLGRKLFNLANKARFFDSEELEKLTNMTEAYCNECERGISVPTKQIEVSQYTDQDGETYHSLVFMCPHPEYESDASMNIGHWVYHPVSVTTDRSVAEKLLRKGAIFAPTSLDELELTEPDFVRIARRIDKT